MRLVLTMLFSLTAALVPVQTNQSAAHRGPTCAMQYQAREWCYRAAQRTVAERRVSWEVSAAAPVERMLHLPLSQIIVLAPNGVPGPIHPQSIQYVFGTLPAFDKVVARPKYALVAEYQGRISKLAPSLVQHACGTRLEVRP